MAEDTASESSLLMRTVSSINSPGEGMTPLRSLGQLRQAWQSCTKGTIFSSIFTLLTTCIGAGTLSLPYAFAQGGLVTAWVIFIVIMGISIVVGFMLFAGKRYCAELFPKMEVWGYEDLAQAAFGAVGKIAVLVTLVVLLFLSLIAYMIYARDQLDLIVQFALSRSGHVPNCSPLVNCALLMAMAFIPLFPITLLRDLTPMQVTSTLSILCITYVAIVMAIKTSTAWVHHLAFNSTTSSHTDPLPPDHTIALWPTKFTGLLTAISYCSLAFVCHFNLLPLQKELQKPTRCRLNMIVIGSMVIAFALYNVVIFSGYFNFFQNTMEDVMLNYSRDDVLVTSARVALFLTLLFSYPVLLHPTREAINRLLEYMYSIVIERMTRTRWNGNGVGEKDEEQPFLLAAEGSKKTRKVSNLIWFCETLVIFGTTFLPASFIPNVGYVWNFVGSIGGTLILYIFPAAMYLRLRYMRYKHRSRLSGITISSQYDAVAVMKEVIAWGIVLLGGLLLIVENYQAIDAVISASHEPSSLCLQLKCEQSHFNFTNSTV